MVNAGAVAKMALQPVNDLGSQGNLRQQVEDLFALPDGFFDQLYVELCFAAGGHPVKQRHIMLLKPLPDIVEGLFLFLIEYDLLFPGRRMVEIADFFFIYFKNAFSDKGL